MQYGIDREFFNRLSGELGVVAKKIVEIEGEISEAISQMPREAVVNFSAIQDLDLIRQFLFGLESLLSEMSKNTSTDIGQGKFRIDNVSSLECILKIFDGAGNEKITPSGEVDFF